VEAAINRLVEFPFLYPFGDSAGLSEAPVTGGYRIIYQISPDTTGNATAGDVLQP
jgi:hypothetical protein